MKFTKPPDKAKPKERRRTQRQKFDIYMRVVNDDTQQTVGHLVELSKEGMRVETSSPIATELDFNLRMELTPDVSDRLFIFFSARSKWCRPDTIMPNLYHVGFQLIDINPHDHEIYQRLLEKYAV